MLTGHLVEMQWLVVHRSVISCIFESLISIRGEVFINLEGICEIILLLEYTNVVNTSSLESELWYLGWRSIRLLWLGHHVLLDCFHFKFGIQSSFLLGLVQEILHIGINGVSEGSTCSDLIITVSTLLALCFFVHGRACSFLIYDLRLCCFKTLFFITVMAMRAGIFIFPFTGCTRFSMLLSTL